MFNVSVSKHRRAIAPGTHIAAKIARRRRNKAARASRKLNRGGR